MKPAAIAALPFVDEHTTLVAARPDAVWRGLGDVLDRSFTRPRATGYARLVGAADHAVSGPRRPPAEGSVFAGFRVVSAQPGRELVLAGRHRFSTYALLFHLDAAGPGHTLLRAETRARFPGPLGTLYRLAVIDTGTHALAVRRLLTSVGRRYA
ncbi:hypothetical protein [Streptomyces sp. NPDC001435]|uniref:hypothetical protein n=1 Tax=unclassified Streptomyces TaxID=2593676 RepID=UPI0036BAFD9F